LFSSKFNSTDHFLEMSTYALKKYEKNGQYYTIDIKMNFK